MLSAVHTTGINLDAVLANAVAISVILGAGSTFVVRTVKRSITSAVGVAIDEKVTPQLAEITGELRRHDTRIAHLEGVEEGRRQAVAAAGVTKTS